MPAEDGWNCLAVKYPKRRHSGAGRNPALRLIAGLMVENCPHPDKPCDDTRW
ncbi:MAG: hypothetical protein L3J04_08135 [Robiginitomaculum sp.]|nr:hypothetical protein [Robiginitomaculum sp.]